jgi:hypothetical protein
VLNPLEGALQLIACTDLHSCSFHSHLFTSFYNTGRQRAKQTAGTAYLFLLLPLADDCIYCLLSAVCSLLVIYRQFRQSYWKLT